MISRFLFLHLFTILYNWLIFDSKSSGPSSSSPMTLKCFGVSTDSEITSPTASWKPERNSDMKYFLSTQKIIMVKSTRREVNWKATWICSCPVNNRKIFVLQIILNVAHFMMSCFKESAGYCCALLDSETKNLNCKRLLLTMMIITQIRCVLYMKSYQSFNSPVQFMILMPFLMPFWQITYAIFQKGKMKTTKVNKEYWLVDSCLNLSTLSLPLFR